MGFGCREVFGGLAAAYLWPTPVFSRCRRPGVTYTVEESRPLARLETGWSGEMVSYSRPRLAVVVKIIGRSRKTTRPASYDHKQAKRVYGKGGEDSIEGERFRRPWHPLAH